MFDVLVVIAVLALLTLFAIERRLSSILKELRAQRRDPRGLEWLADIKRDVGEIRSLADKKT
jgi:hypothetical protein